MKLRSDLELLPLDDDVVAFSEEAQCLVGLNSSAALIVRELLNGIPASQIPGFLSDNGFANPEAARSWVASTLEALAAGSLVEGNAPQAQPDVLSAGAAARDARLTAHMRSFTPFEAAAERRYHLLDTCVLVRFAMAEQVPRVDSVLGHLSTDDHRSHTLVMDIDGERLQRGPVRSYIYCNQQPRDFATGLHRVAPLVKGILWQEAVNAYDFLFYFHAGVVRIGQCGVLLPASPGSGKSSLTMALAAHGSSYYSDEVALIRPKTFDVPPVPLAVCVKRSGWNVVRPYFPDISTLTVHRRNDGKVVRYIPPPNMPVTPLYVNRIIFPRYSKDAPTVITPIHRSEALQRLRSECMAARHRMDRQLVHQLLRWIEGIECYALSFSSLEEAVRLVMEAAKGS